MAEKEVRHVYLFRHGQTYFNRNKVFTGWKESKLTPLGIQQAKIIAKKLKIKRIDIAFQTKLSRSKDTLKYVLENHPECKKIITDNRMIERSYGKLEGLSHKVFIRRIGKKMYNLEIEGDAIENLSPRLRKKVERFLGEQEYNAILRGFKIRPPGGKSFADVEKRVKPFIKDPIKLVKKEKVNEAISSHGNSIRLFRKIMEHKLKKDTTKWFIPYDKVFVYKIKV